MRRLGTLLAVAALGLVVLCIRGPSEASAYNYDPTMIGQNSGGLSRVVATTDAGQLKVAPTPKATNVPVLFPDGGPILVAANTSQCAYVGPLANVRLDCRTAACDYRWVTRLPDAGWPLVFPDAGFASPFDTPLPADTPEQRDVVGLPGGWDSICVFFEGAGTLCPSVVP